MSRTQVLATTDEAVAGIADGSTVLIGGFGLAGMPFDLVDALIRQGATDLTVVSNNAGNAEVGLAALLKAGRVRKVVCSYPRQADSYVFDELYRAGRIELEVVPQGTLAVSLAGAHAKLTQLDQIINHRSQAVRLGIPTFTDAAGRASTSPPRTNHGNLRPDRIGAE